MPEQDAAFVERSLQRAAELEAQGHTELARLAYADIVAREPKNVRALNALGLLLYKTGSRKAAQMAFVQAANADGADVNSHLNVAYTYVFQSRFNEAKRHYEIALELDASNRMAHQGLAYVLSELGEEEAAQRHREAGFTDPLISGTYRGEGEPVRVLLLCSTTGGTVSTSQFLDDRIFLTTTLVVELFDPSFPLPPHHVAFNAIGDADRCADALAKASVILANTRAPILNAPSAVLATSRAGNAARLAQLDGVRAPRMLLFERSNAAPASQLGFPVLLRAPGFHTGRFFERVERAEDLEAAAARIPGDEILAIEYLDGRGSDGNYRKYRAIAVDGELYPLHLAISRDWKVHYGTAQMNEPANRAEEERFLADMPSALGSRAMAALRGIVTALQLDYAGIDFGLAPSGHVLLYEANATMTVVVPEAFEAPYRRLPAERIILAVIKMLAKRASLRVSS